nr:DNA-binding protein WhiA [Clostridia bacterium]
MSESNFAQDVRDALCENSLQIKKHCCRRALYFGSITYRRSAKQSDIFIKLFEKLSGEGYGLPDEDSISEIACGCASCLKNYIRGVFIACGTVTDPDSTTYQLEMRISDPENAAALETLLDECGFPPKSAERAGCTVLYYKDSENIEDFLNYIGAQKAAFSVMNAKIMKELRNNANR